MGQKKKKQTKSRPKAKKKKGLKLKMLCALIGTQQHSAVIPKRYRAEGIAVRGVQVRPPPPPLGTRYVSPVLTGIGRYFKPCLNPWFNVLRNPQFHKMVATINRAPKGYNVLIP